MSIKERDLHPEMFQLQNNVEIFFKTTIQPDIKFEVCWKTSLCSWTGSASE